MYTVFSGYLFPVSYTHLDVYKRQGKELAFDTMMGFAGSTEQINAKLDTFCGKDYLANKFVEAEELVDSFTSDVKTHTAAGKFDQYIEQCYFCLLYTSQPMHGRLCGR